MTSRQSRGKETEELVGELNVVSKGWGNYFRLGSVSQAYRSVDSRRARQAAPVAKQKARVEHLRPQALQRPDLNERLGLFSFAGSTAHLPWAKT